ncbi:hypothetical protein [Ornithinimicrobium sediminis]|jgi:hypothetical protein|uniref:hypothetical protein n=1 Tax=Ornithinimicrobium sediminis TaxID=2904603 RepID=UPI001E45FAFF|nr:hypothetical protein [Ornithinimicrobium sediminis]MCE0487271.1 hypothetical protein [Ornithinimicrobium sediminis]
MSRSTLRPGRLRRVATGLAIALVLPLTMAASCDTGEDQDDQVEQQEQDEEQEDDEQEEDD